MKNRFLSPFHCQSATWGLLASFAVLITGSVRAANPVINGDFASALNFGTVPWTVVYVVGGPDDFAIKDRTTGSRRGSSGYGAAFKPYHDAPIHAYFKQTVTGLIPNAAYAVTNWMNKQPTPKPDGFYVSFKMYLETVGGMGNVSSAEATNNVYEAFVVTNTATINGEIEIRMHFDKFNYSVDKWEYTDAWYDDVSMTLIPGQNIIPPYKILFLALTNQTATFNWETVSNQLYSIQVSPDLANWSTFHTNLLATGTNLTFTTNVSLANPQFFRIRRP